jgi:hypothetical protein
LKKGDVIPLRSARGKLESGAGGLQLLYKAAVDGAEQKWAFAI